MRRLLSDLHNSSHNQTELLLCDCIGMLGQRRSSHPASDIKCLHTYLCEITIYKAERRADRRIHSLSVHLSFINYCTAGLL